ncbi:MAG: group 1 glycosyl transferase [Sphingobacteriales bacterium]|nr:group 1 glycosyl transferase [Sphingobacteriales bacterium]
MNLLHVVARMDPKLGGVGEAVKQITNGLVGYGVNNEVVSLDNPEKELSAHDSVSLHPLGPGVGPWCYNSKLLPWLLANLNRFDAVIVHGLWLYPSHAVRKVVNQLRDQHYNKSLRVFVMPHGMLDPYFQQASGRKLKAIRNWIYWKLIEKKVVNQADGLLFTCEEECKLARETFSPYTPNQELVVGLGLENIVPYNKDIKEAFEKAVPQLMDSPYILYLGRLDEKKGIDMLIASYQKLLTAENLTQNGRFPKLIIAGPGKETAYGKSLQSLVNNSSDLKDSIIFPGMLTGASKWGALYGCDVFILPSHQENFGIAIVEALACSKPVLITNKVNIWREIQLENSGIVVPDTRTGIYDLLATWLALPGIEKEIMSMNAQKCFEKYFAFGPASHRFLSAISA